MEITSLQNPLVKSVARLRSSARYRRRVGLMLVEGLDEVELAMAAGHRPRTVIKAARRAEPRSGLMSAEVVTVSDRVFDQLSYRENPDGWLAVFDAPKPALDRIRLRGEPLLVVVEAVEKPGNLGAILRTADAAAVDAVLVCDAQVDLYGPNVVRSSRGTVFSVPMAQVTTGDALSFLRKHNVKVVAGTPSAAREYTAEDLSGAVALAIGTESAGLSDAFLEAADVRVRIPMAGQVNSLNVSVAAALLMFEALRQRSH